MGRWLEATARCKRRSRMAWARAEALRCISGSVWKRTRSRMGAWVEKEEVKQAMAEWAMVMSLEERKEAVKRLRAVKRRGRRKVKQEEEKRDALIVQRQDHLTTGERNVCALAVILRRCEGSGERNMKGI